MFNKKKRKIEELTTTIAGLKGDIESFKTQMVNQKEEFGKKLKEKSDSYSGALAHCHEDYSELTQAYKDLQEDNKTLLAANHLLASKLIEIGLLNEQQESSLREMLCDLQAFEGELEEGEDELDEICERLVDLETAVMVLAVDYLKRQQEAGQTSKTKKTKKVA